MVLLLTTNSLSHSREQVEYQARANQDPQPNCAICKIVGDTFRFIIDSYMN